MRKTGYPTSDENGHQEITIEEPVNKVSRKGSQSYIDNSDNGFFSVEKRNNFMQFLKNCNEDN